jgi:hypothetical protein
MSTEPLNPFRRHLIQILAAAAGSLPLTLALSTSARSGRGRDDDDDDCKGDEDNCICFLAGTRILTDRGEISIENLKIGDLLITERGAKPIKWIGRRNYSKTGSEWPSNVMPIRIRQGAIDSATPRRDLYLSPSHALFIDGKLIQLSHLTNRTSIHPDLPRGVSTIHYFHIELDTHEIIFAEGAPVESFLSTWDRRETFSNFAEYGRLYEDDGAFPMKPYALIYGYGARDEMLGLLRRAAWPIVDIRDPVQVVYDRLAKRSKELAKF